jgi:anthranilate synthase component 1
MKIKTKIKTFNADTYSPVGVYLSLRDHFRKPCLLESNDYHDRSDSKSFIGLEPLAEIKIEDENIILLSKTEVLKHEPIQSESINNQIKKFIHFFNFMNPHFSNGFFAYTGFELSHYKEKHVIRPEKKHDLPDLHLILFKHIIVLDHFNDEGLLVENTFDTFSVNHNDILQKLNFRSYPNFPFEVIGEETVNIDEAQFLENVKTAKNHCSRGDVFQLVLSRQFKQAFVGEDFEVYRQLRRTNPSPYLFYFDFESHRLMGSSPEAQLIVSNGNAEIHPIAGTVKKTGDTAADLERTKFLTKDEKENAEHMMLVDLARNDLSKHCSTVKVNSLREIQSFSHVIHLVSKVTGTVDPNESIPLYLDTFPAGTLSGTPKPKALELIAKYEPQAREFYGGGIGFIGAHGDINMAIIIRSMLSKNNQLFYQAGAGIVIDSIPESELNEVDNKLNAVRTAIQKCQTNKISTL